MRIDVDENNFDRCHVGFIALADLGDAVKNHLQAPRQIAQIQRGRADGAAGDVRQAVAIYIDHAKARCLQTGVNAKNSHAIYLIAVGAL